MPMWERIGPRSVRELGSGRYMKDTVLNEYGTLENHQ